MAEKIIYQEKYKKGAIEITHHSLPRLRHILNNFIVQQAEIKSAGIVVKDGVEMEFQDIRVYLKEGVIQG